MRLCFRHFGVCLLVLYSQQCQSQVILVAQDTANTGQNTNGSLVAVGANDPNWILSSFSNVHNMTLGGVLPVPATPAPAVVASAYPSAWLQNGSKFQWIGQRADQSINPPGGVTPGLYVYQFTFNVPMTGLVTISGNFAADNAATLAVNGVSQFTDEPGNPYPVAYNTLAAFSFSYQAPQGSNVLQVNLDNYNDTGGTINPSAFIMSSLQISEVPEPSACGAISLVGALFLMVLRLLLKERNGRPARREMEI